MILFWTHKKVHYFKNILLMHNCQNGAQLKYIIIHYEMLPQLS
jgi:hypothetical protein